jgi:hypothetical protein
MFTVFICTSQITFNLGKFLLGGPFLGTYMRCPTKYGVKIFVLFVIYGFAIAHPYTKSRLADP